MAAKKFSIGFIGAGGIAGTHAKHLQKREGVVLQAAAYIKPKLLTAFQEKWDVPDLYKDYKKMLRDSSLDAVSVCTPNFLHCKPTIQALEAGKHVIVEKPMGMNTKECQQMIDAAKANKKHLVVGYQYRFHPNARFMQQQVVKKKVGDVKFVRVQALRRRGIPSWGVFGQKELQGGGCLIDIGVHIIEMAHFIIGKPKPISISASTSTYIGDKKSKALAPWGVWDHKTYNVEDLAIGFVRFDNGAVMNIECSFAAHIEKDVWNVQVMGTKGGVEYDPPRLHTDDAGYMLSADPFFVGKQDCFEVKMNHFIDVARDGKTNEAPGEDGLAVQQIIDGMYESAKKGREVKV